VKVCFDAVALEVAGGRVWRLQGLLKRVGLETAWIGGLRAMPLESAVFVGLWDGVVLEHRESVATFNSFLMTQLIFQTRFNPKSVSQFLHRCKRMCNIVFMQKLQVFDFKGV